MRKMGFVRGCCFELIAAFIRRAYLVALKTPPFPPTRFILEPPVGGTEKPLFLLRALPQKNSDFAVLIADEFNLEPVEWHPPGARVPVRPAQGWLVISLFILLLVLR